MYPGRADLYVVSLEHSTGPQRYLVDLVQHQRGWAKSANYGIICWEAHPIGRPEFHLVVQDFGSILTSSMRSRNCRYSLISTSTCIGEDLYPATARWYANRGYSSTSRLSVAIHCSRLPSPANLVSTKTGSEGSLYEGLKTQRNISEENVAHRPHRSVRIGLLATYTATLRGHTQLR